MAGIHRIEKSPKPLADMSPADRLAFVWSGYRAPVQLETRLGRAYEAVYGEFPPLNRSMGRQDPSWQKEDIEGIPADRPSELARSKNSRNKAK
jgi:hypothetical protein